MKTLRPVALLLALAGASLHLGCAEEEVENGRADEVKTGFASPGKDLGKASSVIADVEDDAAFVVFDRKLERRKADGSVEAVATVGSGFEQLVVTKSRVAYLTSTIVSNMNRVIVHVLSRRDGWKEIHTEDLSADQSTYRHPIAFLDDETLAVGCGDEVRIVGADGSTSKIGGYQSKFRGDEVAAIYPSGTASRFFARLDNDEVYEVNTTTKALTLQPKREGTEPNTHVVFMAFEPKTKSWVTTDFDGIKIYGLDGKLVRKVDLVTEKHRVIWSAAVLPDGKLLVSHESEKSQERSVLATYDLASLERTEVGTFDGSIRELSPAKSLFYKFSPTGAAGFNSRVWYAYARKL